MNTLVIGLDAATWRRIDPLLDRCELPTLQSLLTDGVRGTLDSTMPPMTPLAWTSIATGVNPGKHGVYDFIEQNRRSHELSPYRFSRMNRPTVWDLLNADGIEVGVVNYPVAAPGTTADPFFVSGIPSEVGDDIAHPPEIGETLERVGYRVHPRESPDRGVKAYYDELVSLTEAQCAATIELCRHHDPAVLWTVFMGIDWAQHYLWEATIDGEDAVDRFYAFMDGVVADVLDAIDDDCNVVLLSDHGARKIRGEIYTNSLLKRWGYLSRADRSPSPLDRLRRGVLGWGHRLGSRLPRRWKEQVKETIAESTLQEARKAVGGNQLDVPAKIEWETTDAFAFGYMGRLFVHRQDTYQDGAVSDERAEGLIAELIDRLEGLEHPESGERLIDWAVPADSVYHGPHVDRAPDVLFAPADWRYMVYGDFGDDWLEPPKDRVADHDPDGIVVVSGPDSNRGVVDMDVTDIAPLVLYLHDSPILDDMDGTVPRDALSEDLTERREVRVRESVSDYIPTEANDRAPDSSVRDRLDDLGYL